MPKALIFDLDGTIIKLTLPLEAMRSEAKRYYTKKGMPPELFEPADGISSSTAKARDFFLTNGVSEMDWQVMQEELDDIMSAFERSSAEDVVLIDGAIETLSSVTAKGLRIAVLTNNSRPAMDIILKKIPLDRYFELIHTRHESPSPKPYPDGLLYLTYKLGLQPKEVVYIGDAMIDGVAATRAGIEFWGVASGETSPDILKESGAKMVLSSLSELNLVLSTALSSDQM
ncbi:MAG: HAD family hydrolase [Candidatus Thorarchaeota archaeon]